MQCKELNPDGNFDPWEASKLEELKKKKFVDALGQKLLYENKNIRIWEVILFPKERLPFRKVYQNYSFVSMTAGLAVSRCATGKIALLRFKKGDSVFMESDGSESVYDLENIGDNILFFHIMEFNPLIENLNSTTLISDL